MPPCDYSKYDPAWFTEIRPRILKRANNCCEDCGVKNYDTGYRDANGKFYCYQEIEDALEKGGYDYFAHELSNAFDKKGNPTKPIKIILTISHENHDTNDNRDENLKARCQRCHNNHDKDYRKNNSRKTIEQKKNLQRLF